MKANKIESGRHLGPVVIATLLLLAALAGGIVAYDKLKGACQDQCLIRDMSEQVFITSGKMVRPGTIAEEFGLKVGANLATIDFARKRKEILAKIPNLREIRVTRRLPDKLFVSADERSPIARISAKGARNSTGRVVDAEGVVFICQRGTQSLPLIREHQGTGTPKGQTVNGRIMAALRLVECCRAPKFLELGVLEIDTTKPDFLVVTLGNYSQVKIAWDEMDESTPAALKDLDRRLSQLVDTIRSHVATETVIWNATIPGRIFADTQGRL